MKFLKNREAFFLLLESVSDELTEFLTKKKCYKKGSKWNCDRSLLVGNNENRINIIKKGELIVKFGIIKKTFSLASNNKDGQYPLINCKNFPSEVGEKVLLGHNMITSLKGFPAIVGGDVMLNNNKLTNLVGLPKIIHGDLRIEGNPLTSLKGLTIDNCPEDLGLFDTKLETLKDLPANVKQVNINTCRTIKTITHVLDRDLKIVKFVAINNLTKMVEYEVEAYNKNNTTKEFYNNLFNVLIKNNVNVREYKYWPKGFLNSNLGKSADNIVKFKL